MSEPWDIAVDLDGVLYDFVEVFAREARGCGLAHVRVPECPRPMRWDFYRSWGLSAEEFAALFAGGVQAGRIFWEGPMYAGVREGWRSLVEQGHRLHVITDRSPAGVEQEAREATEAWLAGNGFADASLTITAEKGAALARLVTDPARALFIDDKPENILQAREVGIASVLMDQPWNADFAHPRVRTFSQFAALVADESQGHPVLPAGSRRPGAPGVAGYPAGKGAGGVVE